ncbi:MAG: molybdopterin-dependent oxidoreductase, partial [Candidatus Poribacteria bacterium]|nr:molybdopterin-dependent oxidoreductase [Candidatus Poribacteria bacterium]
MQSLCNLALMTGHIGREGTGLNPMRGQNNIQGAGDGGALPNNYPGFQPVTDVGNQAKFQLSYGREVDLEKGITKVTALNLCGDQIRAMLINGENTLISDPDRQHCQHALESLDHLVVIDIFLTETAELADVVLPATAFAETDGTTTNTERRVQRLRAAVSPPGKAKPDWWIIDQIAYRLGIPNFGYQHPKAIFNELCSLSPIYTGLNWDRVANGAYQWPVPEVGHPGTPILHQDEFPIGRGRFTVTNYRDPHETISEDFPVWLTTGRRLASYHTRTQTGRAQGIDYLLAEEALEVHPDDVRDWGLIDDDWCHLSSARGTVKIRVKATNRSPRGTVFASFSFSDVP